MVGHFLSARSRPMITWLTSKLSKATVISDADLAAIHLNSRKGSVIRFPASPDPARAATKKVTGLAGGA